MVWKYPVKAKFEDTCKWNKGLARVVYSISFIEKAEILLKSNHFTARTDIWAARHGWVGEGFFWQLQRANVQWSNKMKWLEKLLQNILFIFCFEAVKLHRVLYYCCQNRKICFTLFFMWRTLPPFSLQTAFWGPYFPLRTASLFSYGKWFVLLLH